MRSVQRFFYDETGATAIEYALLVALIGIPLIVAAQMVSVELSATFETIGNALSNARQSAGF